MLWMSGQGTLTVVDLQAFQAVESLEDFWVFQGQRTMPIAACCNLIASKIIAASESNGQGSILHYVERPRTEKSAYFQIPVYEAIRGMASVSCMEVSFDQETVYLGGRAEAAGGQEGAPMVVACSFDDKLTVFSDLMLNRAGIEYGTPCRMTRIKGTEVVVIGCDRSIAIIENDRGSLVLLGSVLDIHRDQICDFVANEGYIYSKGVGEPFVVVTEFADAIKYIDGPPVEVDDVLSANTPYYEFRQAKIEHPALENLEKVVVTNNGNTLLTGGTGLHKFERDAEGVMLPTDIDEEFSKW